MRRAYLELSTAHIKHETSKWLDGVVTHLGTRASDVLSIVPFDKYGWWIWVGEEIHPLVPDELAYILTEARKLDCDWVLFDCDVEPTAQFPTFDW